MVLVLMIWASIAALWGLQAAETHPHPPPLELVFPALDLMFPVEGSKGQRKRWQSGKRPPKSASSCPVMSCSISTNGTSDAMRSPRCGR